MQYCTVLRTILDTRGSSGSSPRSEKMLGAGSTYATEPNQVVSKKQTSPMPEQTPDYNERLAYGTDQGRWLAEQVQGSSRHGTHRRTNSGSRAFHDLDQLQPFAGSTSQQDALVVDSKLQRVVSRCSESLQEQQISSRTIRVVTGAFGVMMMLIFLTRFV